jgi:glycosyltransferase involved in cell wall biosynthesis
MSRAIIVIPCYNEEKRLDLGQFLEYALDQPPHRLLFVNDGSTDQTREMLAALAEQYPEQFMLHSLSCNSGKAEAVRQGVLKALEFRPDYVGFWDADLATPLNAIQPFCELLDRHSDLDTVFGARVRLLGRSIERHPVRHYLGRLFAACASCVLGIGIYDTQCGAKLFRVRPATKTLFETTFSTKWIFDVEIIARMILHQRYHGGPSVEKVIYEFPLERWHDVGGSKVRAADFFKAIFQLAVVYYEYIWSNPGDVDRQRARPEIPKEVPLPSASTQAPLPTFPQPDPSAVPEADYAATPVRG